MNGSETTTTLASIMSMTVVVSSAHTTRSVRGVGWCSMVRLAPRIHTPARSERSPRVRRPARRPRRRVRHRPRPGRRRPGGPLVYLAPGVPHGRVRLAGDHARRVLRALLYILSVNLLTTTSLGSAARCRRTCGRAAEARPLMLRLVDDAYKIAHTQWGAVRFRNGVNSPNVTASLQHRRPPRRSCGTTIAHSETGWATTMWRSDR